MILVSHPLARLLSLAERGDVFFEVTGFSAGFTSGSEDAVLIRLPLERDCGHSRYEAPDAIYIVGMDGTLWDIGVPGLVFGLWWIDDRWVLLNRISTESGSVPTPWSIWHIGQVEGDWQIVVNYAFDPLPLNPYDLPVLFEDGYQTMIAEVRYLNSEHPCELNSEFTDIYRHGFWKAQNTYQLIDDQYELIDAQVLEFPVILLETDEPVSIDWQAYCINPEP